MYNELIRQAREILSRDDAPVMARFGTIVDKPFLKALADALEAEQKEIEQLTSMNQHNLNCYVSEHDRAEKAEAEIERLKTKLMLSEAREHPQDLFPELTPQQRAENAEIVALTIRAEKAEAENRWIPVSERLPEDDPTIPMHKEFHMEFCSVLAIGIFRGCENGKPAVSMANRIRLKRMGIRYIDSEIKTEDWQWSAPFQSVTHWRPLPEPPKGE